MGILSRSAWEGSCIGFLVVGVVFNGLVLYSLHQLGCKAKRGSRVQVEDKGLCACLFRRCSDWRRTMFLSKASVACFLLFAVVGFVHRSLYFALCDDCRIRSALFALYTTCGIVGYGLMFSVHFERLRLTFRGSVLKLPQWAPKLMYGSSLLFVVLFVGSTALRFSHPKVSSVITALAAVVYVLGVCTLIRAFFKKTLASASRNATIDKQLLEVAARITVVVTLSVLSTTFTLLMYVALMRFCSMCFFWLTVAMAVTICDHCLNSFCLMCTFGGAEAAYKRVFGAMHNVLLSHVSKTSPIKQTPAAGSRYVVAVVPTDDEH